MGPFVKGVAESSRGLLHSTLRCGADISCQPPIKYANRFLEFIYKA